MFLTFVIAPPIFLWASFLKDEILKLYLYIVCLTLYLVPLLSLELNDGQDYGKYYELLANKSSIQQALTFYSSEYIFWGWEFLLSRFDGEVFRDLNVILLFLIPFLIGRIYKKSASYAIKFTVIQWSFPGTYLLWGNPLRQHLMVLVLIYLFLLIRHRFLKIAAPLLAYFIHKSALVTLPMLLTSKGFRLIGGGVFLFLAGAIEAFGLYQSFTGGDIRILFFYLFVLALYSVLSKSFDYIFLAVMLCVIYLVNPLIAERLLLVVGPVVAATLLEQAVFNKKLKVAVTFQAVIVGLMLFIFRPESIELLYGSIL